MWTARVDKLRWREPRVTVGSDFPGPGSVTWRPQPLLIAIGVAASLGAAIWVFLASDPEDLIVGVVIALVLAVLSFAGWRRRVIGGPRGLLICGFGRRRMVPWSQVRSMDNATTRRFGLSSTTIEVDLVDDDLLIFGRTDLGADPEAVLTTLRGFSARR